MALLAGQDENGPHLAQQQELAGRWQRTDRPITAVAVLVTAAVTLS
jgi:hypothetical protein